MLDPGDLAELLARIPRDTAVVVLPDEILDALRGIPDDERQAAAGWFAEKSEDPAEGTPRVRECLAQLGVAVGAMRRDIDPATTLSFFDHAGISRN